MERRSFMKCCQKQRSFRKCSQKQRSFMKCGQKQRRFMKCCQKKVTFIQKTAKSATVQKNDKQRIVEVKRDILSCLANLSASSALVVNYEKAMEYPLSPVPLTIATTPPNSPKLVILVDPNKSLTTDLIAAIRRMTKISETHRQLV